jgi:methylmalonyl-CoA mutase cobalamin-binding subunit
VIQEDAGAVGPSILSGTHMTLVPLKALGVAEVCTPGAPTQAIIEFIRSAGPRPCGRQKPRARRPSADRYGHLAV